MERQPQWGVCRQSSSSDVVHPQGRGAREEAMGTQLIVVQLSRGGCLEASYRSWWSQRKSLALRGEEVVGVGRPHYFYDNKKEDGKMTTTRHMRGEYSVAKGALLRTKQRSVQRCVMLLPGALLLQGEAAQRP